MCVGDTLSIAPTGSFASLNWQDDSDQTALQVLAPGIYQVKATHENGCTARAKTLVRYHSKPQPNLGADIYTCAGEKPILKPGKFDTYVWHNGSKDPSFQVTTPGRYAVEVTNVCGDKAKDELQVVQRDLPKISLGKDQVLCAGDTLTLEAGDAFGSYVWNARSAKGSRLPVWESGTYTVTAADVSGCVQKASLRVEVVACTGDMLVFPAQISPDGDGLNDHLKPVDPAKAQKVAMQVFDASGRLLFFSEKIQQGWDGTFQKKNLPPGSYPYTIQYTDPLGNTRMGAGQVEIK